MTLSDHRLVPIRTVCAMYGLNPNTLRTWERRYGIVRPERSEGGHRGYGERDLANIEAMLRLLAQGIAPAEAARQIQPAKANGNGASVDDIGEHAQVREHRRLLRAAIKSMDLAAATHEARAALESLGYTQTIECVVFPELIYLGERWTVDDCGIAREHMGTLVARTLILEHQREVMPQARGPAVVLACAPEENHEVPVLHIANLLATSGEITPVPLVGGLPIVQVLDTAKRAQAAAIVLSATMAPRPDIVRQWIGELAAAGWESRTVLVGPGFTRSRVFSETKVRSAAGGYGQVLRLLRRMFSDLTPTEHHPS